MSDTEGPFVSKGFKNYIKHNVVIHQSNGKGNKPTVSTEDRNQTTQSNLACSAGVETLQGENGEILFRWLMKYSACSLTTEIRSPKGGPTCCHAVQTRQSGEWVYHLHNQGPNYYKKYQTYLLQGAPAVSCGGKNTDLGAQKPDLLLCCSLLGYTEKSHSLYRHMPQG